MGWFSKLTKFTAWHTYLFIGPCKPIRILAAYGTVKLLSLDAQLGEPQVTCKEGKHAGPGPWASHSVGFPSAARHHCLFKRRSFFVHHLTSFYLARESRSLSFTAFAYCPVAGFWEWPENFLLVCSGVPLRAFLWRIFRTGLRQEHSSLQVQIVKPVPKRLRTLLYLRTNPRHLQGLLPARSLLMSWFGCGPQL